ncbi:MFS transporter [Planctomycetaceae bacterium]|nr:MFS transporter [Planctomycetaceae bacterium]MDC0273594.1 MFS transporter [Planctomycetaceae bacterium]
MSANSLRRQQIFAVVAMYFGYAMFMVLRMIPGVAGAAMQKDPTLGIDLEVFGQILSLGTCGAILGNFIGGYAADRFGGRITFAVGLAGCAAFTGLFAASSSVIMFQMMFFLALMSKSLGWPAMTKMIGNWFQPNEYGRVWGIISTSSRVGTLIATFGFGALLVLLPWRVMLFLCSGVGILVAIAFLILMKEKPAEELAKQDTETSPSDDIVHHPLNGTTIWQSLSYFARSRQFWLITGSLMGLTILWDFLLMVPSFLGDTLDLPVEQASMAASAFPFGSLISVLVGGFVFDKLNRNTTAWLMGGFLLLASGCLGVFLLMPQFNMTLQALTYLSLILLFLFGLCISPCYYIPMSVFSIEFGGPHSGVLISLLDALVFGATALFYFFGGGIAAASWERFLIVLLGISLWSCVTTFLFMKGEASQQKTMLATDR